MTSNPNERSENFSVGETARLRLSNIRGPARPTSAPHPAPPASPPTASPAAKPA